jgi:hypothetical protein
MTAFPKHIALPVLQQEARIFLKMIARLTKDHAGEYCVFQGGFPISYHPSFEDAYGYGMRMFYRVGTVFLVAHIHSMNKDPLKKFMMRVYDNEEGDE